MKNKIFIILIGLSSILFANDITDAKTSASNLGNMARGKIGSKSGISTNISNPLQTNTNLTSLNGSVSFSANITTCSSNNNNGVSLKFDSGANNVINITLKHDKNGDGSYDYTSVFNDINYVCGGGIKKSDGKYYKWIFNPNTRVISLNLDTKTNLDTCYCILNNCNYGGYSKNIADNITGDIIASVGTSSIDNYSLGINSYDDSNRIYYLYVKDSTACSNSSTLGNTYTNTNPKEYFSSQNDSALDYTDVMMKDKNNASSLYYITKNQNDVLINSSSGNNNIAYSNFKTCLITKKPITNSSSNITVEVNNNCSIYESNSSCSLNRESVCDYGGNNCIDTILNNSSTSYSVPIHCIDYNNEYQVCDNGSSIYKVSKISGANQSIYFSAKSYFYTTRTYDCGDTSSNFNSSKTNNVVSSVSKSGNQLNYTSFNGSSEAITLGDYQSCEVRYCSYKKNGNSTVEYSDGTTNNNTNDGTSTFNMGYKECNKLANGSYTCPLNSGETMVEACSCSLGMNGAGTTLGYISAIEEMVNDFTCSTN